MVQKSFFKKHYTRLALEGVLKSAFAGLLVGGGANFLSAFAAWFFDFGGIWFAIGVGAGVAVVSGFLFYLIKFRPTVKEIAERVDRLGLEERLITMLELEKDESYIAMLQRENAKEHLKDVENRKLRLRLSKVTVVVTLVVLLIGSSMTTVVGLAESEMIPSGTDIITPDPLEFAIPVTFEAGEGGEIQGEPIQLVLPGEDTTPVVAVADDGYMFVGWDDGYSSPDRQELGVTEEIILTALFEPVVEGGEELGDQENQNGNGGQEGDKADDLPPGGDANVNDAPSGGEGEEGNGSGSDGNNDGGKGESEEEGEGKGDGKGQGAGGKWEDSNQFIDGQTYYRDQLDMYYQLAMQIFESEGEIPPEMREFFEMYFGSI